MINVEKLEKKQVNHIKNMELDDLQQYLDNLANEYYNCIINQDTIKLNVIKSNIHNVLELHADKNLDLYILYALNDAFINILMNSAKNGLDLRLDMDKPPILTGKDNYFVRKNKLDNVIDYIRDKQVEKAVDEFYNSNPSYDDLLKMFNFNDLKV